MPVSSRTDICNLALAELGARRINSIEDATSVEGNACRLHFDQVMHSLLDRHQWSFATARAGLSRILPWTALDWATAWQLPGDLVRLIRVDGWAIRDWSIEGRKLLARGAEAITIVYVSNAIPVPDWDPLFVDAVTYLLAARIAGEITKNPQLADSCLEKLERLALPQARLSDAQESQSGENSTPAHMIARSSLVAARFRRSAGRIPRIPAPGDLP